MSKPEYPAEHRHGFATPQAALVTFVEDGAKQRYPKGTPEKVRRWQQDGYLVNVWTVDDPHSLHALAAMGVDAVITNDPRLFGAPTPSGTSPR